MHRFSPHQIVLRCCALIISIIILILPAAERRESSADLVINQKLGSSLHDAETLFFAAKGEGEHEIAYIYDDAGNNGPESFAVENGVVYLLDSVNSRLLINKSGETHAVALDGCLYPSHMCVENGIILIADAESEELLVCNESGIISSVALPEDLNTNDIYRIHPNGSGTALLLTHDLYQYILNVSDMSWSEKSLVNVINDGKGCYSLTVPTLSNSLTVDCGTDAMLQYINTTNDMLFVGVYNFVPDVSIIMTEHVIKSISTDGELIGCTVVDTENACSYPNDDTYISSEGKLYILHCNNDGAHITCPILRKSYHSSMEGLTQRALLLETKKPMLDMRTIQPVCIYKRPQVRTRAVTAAYHLWQVSSDNKTVPANLSSVVTLPAYVSNASAGDYLTGIPYAWGKMATSVAQFDSDASNGLITGNINSAEDLGVSDTIGMDCAGFLSYCYGFTSRIGSGVFYSYGYPVYSSAIASGANSSAFANMKQMDFLVKCNFTTGSGHVILFDSIYSSSVVKMFESVKTIYYGNGKVYSGNKSISDLNGYYRRSPYSCTSAGCIGGSSYSYNDNAHWKICVTCGAQCNVSAHIWVTYGSGYRCSVCGKISASGPQPSGLEIYERVYMNTAMRTTD